MKIKWLVVCILLLAGCRKKKAPLAEAVFPVYKVDLDKVDSVNMRDIFSAVELIPLQKKAGYTITSPQGRIKQWNPSFMKQIQTS